MTSLSAPSVHDATTSLRPDWSELPAQVRDGRARHRRAGDASGGAGRQGIDGRSEGRRVFAWRRPAQQYRVAELVMGAEGRFDRVTPSHGDLRPDNLLVARTSGGPGVATLVERSGELRGVI